MDTNKMNISKQEQCTMSAVLDNLLNLIDVFFEFRQDDQIKEARYFGLSIIPVIGVIGCCATTFSRYDVAEQLDKCCCAIIASQSHEDDDTSLIAIKQLGAYLDELHQSYDITCTDINLH